MSHPYAFGPAGVPSPEPPSPAQTHAFWQQVQRLSGSPPRRRQSDRPPIAPSPPPEPRQPLAETGSQTPGSPLTLPAASQTRAVDAGGDSVVSVRLAGQNADLRAECEKLAGENAALQEQGAHAAEAVAALEALRAGLNEWKAAEAEYMDFYAVQRLEAILAPGAKPEPAPSAAVEQREPEPVESSPDPPQDEGAKAAPEEAVAPELTSSDLSQRVGPLSPEAAVVDDPDPSEMSVPQVKRGELDTVMRQVEKALIGRLPADQADKVLQEAELLAGKLRAEGQHEKAAQLDYFVSKREAILDMCQESPTCRDHDEDSEPQTDDLKGSAGELMLEILRDEQRAKMSKYCELQEELPASNQRAVLQKNINHLDREIELLENALGTRPRADTR